MKNIRILSLISILLTCGAGVQASHSSGEREFKISGDTTRLLRMTQACNIFSRNISCVNLYIPSRELATIDSGKLEELFCKHHIQLPLHFLGVPLSSELRRERLAEYLEQSLSKLELTAKFIESPSTQVCPYYMLPIENSVQFLKEVADVLTAYLPADETDLSYILENSSKLDSKLRKGYVEKNTRAVLRTLSCALLQEIIQERQLKHVRVPRKFLIVFDKKLNKYLSVEETRRVLNRMFALELNPYEGRVSLINILKPRYKSVIFAERCEPAKRNLSDKAIEEMQILIRSGGLFDVGEKDYCNILSDAEGNAIIVDTEARAGLPEKDCIAMLTKHYSHSK